MAIHDTEEGSVKRPFIAATSHYSSKQMTIDSTQKTTHFSVFKWILLAWTTLTNWLYHLIFTSYTNIGTTRSTRIVKLSHDRTSICTENNKLIANNYDSDSDTILESTRKVADSPLPARSGRARRQANNTSLSLSSSSSSSAAATSSTVEQQKHHSADRASARAVNAAKGGSAASTNTRPTTRIIQLPARKTLVLDLDETLVHADQHGGSRVDHVVEVVMDGYAQLYFIGKRPHTDYFLRKVSQWYELVVFTASLPEYADPVIDWLDPDACYFKRRLFRSDCTPRGFSFAKDLSLIQADLSRVILVDNSPACFALHKENGLPISGWYDDQRDEALLELLPVLDALRFVDDVRSILRLRLCSHRRPTGAVFTERMSSLLSTAQTDTSNYTVMPRRSAITVQHSATTHRS
ncbi:NLI interacting factor-like phosphatase-domain-containing protein [Syncephalis fuscata]|nr:NLI interacting factor-like phosphatase-domain-containing protein [Syncephalis fuscata]